MNKHWKNKEMAEILPAEWMARLSPPAARVYVSIWNDFGFFESPQMQRNNDKVCSLAHVTLEELEAAKRELVQDRLLNIQPLPGNTGASYSFPEVVR